jgi:hypothetical protein
MPHSPPRSVPSAAPVALVLLFALSACGGERNDGGTWIAVAAPPTTVVVTTEPSAPRVELGPSATSDVVLRNVASRKCLDVPRQAHESRTLLWEWECNGTVAQRWTMTKVGDTTYRLSSRASGKCLDVPYASTGSNINVWQFDCNGTPAQTWELERTADGSFLVRSRASSLCLDVPHGQAANGLGIQQYPCHGGPPQRWTVTAA